MKKDVVIKVEGIGKKYSIGKREKYLTLRDRLMELPKKLLDKKNKKEEFWALKDVSFEVQKGDVLGVIGGNGAGKSTMLKVLSRITEPTEGKVTMRGRVASMLEVGTGFNPELTGRENIYLNGAILGMARKEIEVKFKEIVEFSGIGKFLDTPVKHYSSGMYVRLAFSVAAHLDSDILLVDEVLAVGDSEFQKKCLGKMHEISHSGRKTVIFVSHNLTSIRNLCEKSIYLENGTISKFSKTNEVIKYYEDQHAKPTTSTTKINKNNKIQIRKVSIRNARNRSTNKLSISENFNISVEFTSSKKIREGVVAIYLYALDGNLLLFSTSADYGNNKISFDKGRYMADIKFPRNVLNVGKYRLNISIQEPLIQHYDRSADIIIELTDKHNYKTTYMNGNPIGILSSKLNYQVSRI